MPIQLRSSLLAAVFCLAFALPATVLASDKPVKGCQSCHADLEPAVPKERNMMRALSDMDISRTGGCSSCHGGSPLETDKKKAHQGGPGYGLLTRFAAHPTTRPAVEQACGTCHRDKTFSLPLSRMQMENPRTKAGLVNGLPAYQKRVRQTFLNNRYNAPACMDSCHLWPAKPKSNGSQGCAACHFAQTEDGYYDGLDKKLVNQMREARLTSSAEHTLLGSAKVKSVRSGLSGIPVNACLACHEGGNAVGARFVGRAPLRGYVSRGLLYRSSSTSTADIHFQKGLWCQDCHTGIDIHGDGVPRNRPGKQVEIECADCHGTPQAAPWDLPLFFQDDITLPAPRGVTTHVLPTQLHGTPPQAADGFLLTARGNPIGNVVQQSGKVILYDHAGVTHTVPMLLGSKAHDYDVKSHDLTKMECYLCHTQLLDKRATRNPRSPNRMAKDPDGLLAPVAKGVRYTRKQAAPARPVFAHDTRRKSPPCQNCHKDSELMFRNRR